MKLKGINPIEQHVEKAVLAVAVLIFIGILTLQFVSQPTVQVGSNEYLPGQSYDPAESAAQRLEAAMTSTDPEIPEYEAPDLESRFAAALEGGAGEAVALSNFGAPMQFEDLSGGSQATTIGDLRIAAVRPEAPQELRFAVNRGSIDPVAVARDASLASVVGSEQPHDLVAVTVEATIDGQALAATLEADPDGDGPLSALPRRWWIGAVELLGVELERQARDETGAWGSSVMVPGYVMRDGPLALLAAGQAEGQQPTRELLNQVISSASQNAIDVAMPSFPPVIAGSAWETPGEAERRALVEGNRGRIGRIEAQFDAATASVEELEKSLESQSEPLGDEETARIEGEIAEFRAQLADYERELRALGWVPEDEVAGGVQLNASALLDDERRSVWAHDLTAEPGATYRYRARIVVNNPAFGQGAALNEDQADIALQPLALGAWSAWTAPVRIEPDAFAFFTRGRVTGVGGEIDPGASAELYRFYYGYWRGSTLGLEPGDAVADRVTLATDLPLYEIASDGENYEATRVSGPSELSVDTGLTLLDAAPAVVVGASADDTVVILADSQGRIVTRRSVRDAGDDLRDELAASARAAASQATPEPEE